VQRHVIIGEVVHAAGKKDWKGKLEKKENDRKKKPRHVDP
jgi:hypothetical protein